MQVRPSRGCREVEVRSRERGCFKLKRPGGKIHVAKGLMQVSATSIKTGLFRDSNTNRNIRDGDDYSVFQVRSLQQNYSWNRNPKLYHNEGNCSPSLPSPRARRTLWSAKRCACGSDARPLWVEAES